MNLKYQEIIGFVQKTSLLKPPPPSLAPYPQTRDALPLSDIISIIPGIIIFEF